MTGGLIALVAALAFAVATVLQHRAAAAAEAPAGAASLTRLAVHLTGRPVWLLGTVAGGVGLVLHALAVRVGQVVLVQPLLLLGLPLSLAAGAVLERTRPSRAQGFAALQAAAGLAIFLLSARPQPGTALGRTDVLLVGSAGMLLVLLAAVLWGRRPHARHRALLLGVAAGSGFGVTGVLVKQVVDTPVGQLLHTWPVFALLAVGLPSVVVAQWAFQSGSLSACLPAMTMMEPVVAVVLGALGFSEQLDGTVPGRTGQLLGLLLTLAAVVRLARLQSEQEKQRSQAPAARPLVLWTAAAASGRTVSDSPRAAAGSPSARGDAPRVPPAGSTSAVLQAPLPTVAP